MSGNREGKALQVHQRLLAGSTAGVIAQTTIYPMEVSLSHTHTHTLSLSLLLLLTHAVGIDECHFACWSGSVQSLSTACFAEDNGLAAAGGLICQLVTFLYLVMILFSCPLVTECLAFGQNVNKLITSNFCLLVWQSAFLSLSLSLNEANSVALWCSYHLVVCHEVTAGELSPALNKITISLVE